MEESIFYISEGDPADKHSQESFAVSTSIHSSQQFASYRQCDAPQHGAALTGVGFGERLFTCSKNKALLQVYSWGKESPDQRIPVPEQLSCITLCKHPKNYSTLNEDPGSESATFGLPAFRVPWLLAAGSKTGKIYIWELSSGNLLCVKDAHYQPISVIKFSSCGTYLVSGGEDSRVTVWRTLDLISIYTKSGDNNRLASIRPYATFTDHSLAVSDLILSEAGILPDTRLYTVSRDSTLRIYDLTTKSLLTTFVLPSSIECITKDPASRALYVGLTNGLIRVIPLYQVNPNTSVLEAIGGCEKIVSLDHDPNLASTFVHHQQQQSQQQNVHNGRGKEATPANAVTPSVTNITISTDGTSIISGDSIGRVFVSDIITRQVIQTLKECNSPISYLQINSCPVESVDSTAVGFTTNKVDKNHRLIPPFKRVLASSDPIEHVLYMEIPGTIPSSENYGSFGNFDEWLAEKETQELEYRSNVSNINSTVKVLGDSAANGSSSDKKIKELEEKLAKVSSAYTELRTKHEELYKEHQKLL